MGYIRAREGRYQANVRRKGYATVTKTFTSREAAKSWSKTTEIQMERGEFNPHSSITVEELIKRYSQEVVPNFSGSNPALYRCNTLRRIHGKHRVAELTPATLASYRDERLQTTQPNSLRREFGLLSAAINTAAIDWGISIPSNLFSLSEFQSLTIDETGDWKMEKKSGYWIPPHPNTNATASWHLKPL